jgi:hypothetical protein
LRDDFWRVNDAVLQELATLDLIEAQIESSLKQGLIKETFENGLPCYTLTDLGMAVAEAHETTGLY